MCTYNGASFLQKQLDSIAGQTLLPGELVVCDDGSTDQTKALLERFSRLVEFPVRVYGNEQRLGVIQNYSRAVGLCRGDYVALCDQDDIWQPDKLALSMQGMGEAEAVHGRDTPLLLHTDLRLVDRNGTVIAESMMRTQKINHVEEEPLKTLLVQNFVTGCTALLNRPLIEAALPVPEQVLMHDWWFALTAAALGELLFIPQPTVRYRQHSRNAVGAKKYLSGESVKRLARIHRLEQVIAETVQQGLELKKRLDLLSAEAPGYLPEYLEAASQDGRKAASCARTHQIAKQGRIRNTVFLLLLFKSAYLEYLEEHRAINRDHC